MLVVRDRMNDLTKGQMLLAQVVPMALQRHMLYTDLSLVILERSNDLAILFLMSSTPYRHNNGLQ